MTKRIAIIGCAGSGKTTLAFKLKEKHNLPLYHLDQYYWKPHWKRIEFEVFDAIHDELCERDSWIMEGSYYRVFYKRAFYANVIIFLDVPRYKCIWYVIKRAFLNRGIVLPGSPENCPQRLLSIEFLQFLKWVWHFNKLYKNMILTILEEYKDEKQIYILKSFKEIDDFFNFIKIMD